MILFAHTKFGLVRIQGSRVKGGAESAPPRSERVFQIPVQIGLIQYIAHYLVSKVKRTHTKLNKNHPNCFTNDTLN